MNNHTSVPAMFQPLLSKWGASGWQFIHCCGFSYSETPTGEERRQMYAFLLAVGDVLPCVRCRRHYNAYFGGLTPRGPASHIFDDREALSRALVEMHNDVNHRLGRRTMDYETVRRIYEVDCTDGWSTAVGCGIGALVVAAIIVAYARMPRRALK